MHPHESVRASGFAPMITAAFAFLLPFFFVPSTVFPFQFSKVALALVAVVIAFAVFAITALRKRTLHVEWSWLSFSFILLPLTYLVSSVFSAAPMLSFIGYELDQDTFGFVALASALALVTTLVIRSESRILAVLLGFLAGGWIVLVFQALQVFFGVPITGGLFSTPVQNLVGSWNSFALFTSLIASLALLSLETLSLTSMRRGVLVGTLVLAAALLATTGSTLAWGLFGVVAFALLVFSFMGTRQEGAEGMRRGTGSAASLVAFAIAVFFFFFGAGVTGFLQKQFAISVLDVSPSSQTTLSVLEHVYAKNPVFGSGPNTFSEDWFLYRPAETLSSPFWSTEFNAGGGYFLTAATTGGLAVFLGWLTLIVLFVITAVRALLSAPAADERSYFLLAATAVGSAFLLVAHALYVPSSALTLMLFLFLGLFVVSLRNTRFMRSFSVSFAESPRLGFLSVLVLAVVLVLSFSSLYRVGEAYASSVYAGRAVVHANTNDIDCALSSINQAIALSPQDRYYRTATQLHLAALTTLVQSGANDQKTQAAFQDGLSQAVAASGAALAANSKSYVNLMNRASVYEAVVPLNITGAADSATQALKDARAVNPNSPETDYQEAALKEFAKDHASAKTLAQAALVKKADYTPAILLLAQIAFNQGNLSEAITSLKSALVFNPGDASLLYQLGLLLLQNHQYADAADSFKAALAASPEFANAKFFLAGADVFLEKTDDALAILNELKTANPDNETLTKTIAAVEKGENPFAAAIPLPPEPAASAVGAQ